MPWPSKRRLCPGATLYCVLTGKPPFQGEDLGEALRRVDVGEFAPPRSVDPAIDPALEAICMTAMANRPEDRYPSCRALADDLERWLADEPVSAWREPLGRRPGDGPAQPYGGQRRGGRSHRGRRRSLGRGDRAGQGKHKSFPGQHRHNQGERCRRAGINRGQEGKEGNR